MEDGARHEGAHAPAPVHVPDEARLIVHLEPDQLVAATFTPVPRAVLGPRQRAALWALRLFTAIVGAMVIYTFIAQLH